MAENDEDAFLTLSATLITDGDRMFPAMNEEYRGFPIAKVGNARGVLSDLARITRVTFHVAITRE